MPQTMPRINNGLDLDKERADVDGSEWIFGALSQPGLVSIPSNEREQYLPQGENQFDQFGDFQDCATRSPVNHCEALFTYHYQHAMLPENKKWMEDNGYVANGKVTFSDRFIAKLSGTTRSGNSLKAPLDTIRNSGLIPKSLLPKIDSMTWDQYYAQIPQNLIDLGKEFADRFTLNYEQVQLVHIADVLKDDMVGVAGYAWPAPDANDVYQATPGQFNHAFLLYNLPKFQAFDNYTENNDPNDFTKNLASDYIFYSYGYRMYLAAEKKSPDSDASALSNALQSLSSLLSVLWNLLPTLSTPTPPTPPPPPIPAPPPPTTPVVLDRAGALSDTARKYIGKDASPENRAPQELSCAESVVHIVNETWPGTLDHNIVGTDVLFQALRKSPRFKGVLDPIAGCIEISPRIGDINGHCGIYVDANVIASNDSRDGKFHQNYTRQSWRDYFIRKKGLKAYLFLPV